MCPFLILICLVHPCIISMLCPCPCNMDYQTFVYSICASICIYSHVSWPWVKNWTFCIYWSLVSFVSVSSLLVLSFLLNYFFQIPFFLGGRGQGWEEENLAYHALVVISYRNYFWYKSLCICWHNLTMYHNTSYSLICMDRLNLWWIWNARAVSVQSRISCRLLMVRT